MPLIFHAYWHADFFGKCIFLALFTLSIVTWIFLLQKFWLFLQIKKGSRLFYTAVSKQKKSLLNLTLDQLPKYASRFIPNPFAYIYATVKDKTKEILDKNNLFSVQNEQNSYSGNYLSRSDIDLISSHAWTTITKQREALEKNFFILSTAATIAPFLGLLGTVWGILITFSGLQQGGSLASNALLMSGLSTALVTTVLGLLIAIPALIANNYLKNESRYYLSEMEDFSHFLLSTIELQYRKVDVL